MPPKKSLIKISIQVGDDKLSLNLSPLLHQRYSVKIGRSHSEKIPESTLTEVFDLLRRWVVKRSNN